MQDMFRLKTPLQINVNESHKLICVRLHFQLKFFPLKLNSKNSKKYFAPK
jgi:hypothetical protein